MFSTKQAIFAAAASILAAALGLPAPAAASCGMLCHPSGECRVVPNQPSWGCGSWGQACFDIQCLDSASLDVSTVQKIADAAEAGDLELARKLAADYPSLRIFKAGAMLFNGPQLAGIPGPELTADGVRMACAGAAEAPKAEPTAEPAATEATTEKK